MIEKNIKNQIKNVFKGKSQVLACYFFGSHSLGFAGKKSDLDIAIVVENKQKISQREVLKVLLENVDIPYEIDLTVVDLQSSPLLLFQIIKGNCIYRKKGFNIVPMEAEILHKFYDTQHMRDIYSSYLNKSLKEGKYGYR